MSNRTCNTLGVCQSRVPACNDCEYCPVCEGECAHGPQNTDRMTPMERIAYWGAVGITVAITVCVVFSLAGFAAAKLNLLA